MEEHIQSSVDEVDGFHELARETGRKPIGGAEDGGVGFALAIRLQELSEGNVGVGGRFEADAIGWVGDDEGWNLRRAEEADVGVLEMDGKAC
jgi:hypothetical protein